VNEAAATEPGTSGRDRLVGDEVAASTPTTPAETSALSPEAIERRYLAGRGGNVLSLGTRIKRLKSPSTADCFKAAGDEPDGAA
jgi:hypothetical protein